VVVESGETRVDGRGRGCVGGVEGRKGTGEGERWWKESGAFRQAIVLDSLVYVESRDIVIEFVGRKETQRFPALVPEWIARRRCDRHQPRHALCLRREEWQPVDPLRQWLRGPESCSVPVLVASLAHPAGI